MWGGVDEVGKRDQGGGEADGGAVESGDEDFRVCVEGIRDIKVVGDEVSECVAPNIDIGGERAGNCYVGAAGGSVSIYIWLMLKNLLQDCEGSIRGEVTAFACEDGDVDIVTFGYLAHET